MNRGKLLVVSTPIGNLSDLSPRAVEALRAADLILCEDTRQTAKLLHHAGIETRLQSFHEHNEDEKAARALEQIEHGSTIALVSDAGTPLLSDPGFALIRSARERRLTVEPIPGPFAGIVALVASGLAPMPFAFYGFAPHRSGARLDFYRRIADAAITAIVYESPQRVVESLADAREALGDVEMTAGREMTKLHEEFIHGSISEVIVQLESKETIRGEFTLVFAASHRAPVELPAVEMLRSEMERLRAGGMRRNDAIKALAEKYGVKKNELYDLLIG